MVQTIQQTTDYSPVAVRFQVVDAPLMRVVQ